MNQVIITKPAIRRSIAAALSIGIFGLLNESSQAMQVQKMSGNFHKISHLHNAHQQRQFFNPKFKLDLLKLKEGITYKIDIEENNLRLSTENTSIKNKPATGRLNLLPFKLSIPINWVEPKWNEELQGLGESYFDDDKTLSQREDLLGFKFSELFSSNPKILGTDMQREMWADYCDLEKRKILHLALLYNAKNIYDTIRQHGPYGETITDLPYAHWGDIPYDRFFYVQNKKGDMLYPQDHTTTLLPIILPQKGDSIDDTWTIFDGMDIKNLWSLISAYQYASSKAISGKCSDEEIQKNLEFVFELIVNNLNQKVETRTFIDNLSWSSELDGTIDEIVKIPAKLLAGAIKERDSYPKHFVETLLANRIWQRFLPVDPDNKLNFNNICRDITDYVKCKGITLDQFCKYVVMIEKLRNDGIFDHSWDLYDLLKKMPENKIDSFDFELLGHLKYAIGGALKSGFNKKALSHIFARQLENVLDHIKNHKNILNKDVLRKLCEILNLVEENPELKRELKDKEIYGKTVSLFMTSGGSQNLKQKKRDTREGNTGKSNSGSTDDDISDFIIYYSVYSSITHNSSTGGSDGVYHQKYYDGGYRNISSGYATNNYESSGGGSYSGGSDSGGYDSGDGGGGGDGGGD